MNTRKTRFAIYILLFLGASIGAWAQENVPPDPVADFPDFTPSAYALEGVAVDKIGNVFVTVRESEEGKVYKFTPTGSPSLYADVGKAMIGGLAVDANGDLYVATGPGVDKGVYKIDRDGRTTLISGTQDIDLANALAFDKRGNLYVTESYSVQEDGTYGPGGIWRITPSGEVGVWLQHDLLTGIGAVMGYPVGANGIACYHGDLYVINTDKGFVVRIPILPDGNPGDAQIWATLKEVYTPPVIPYPVMGDGLALDANGNIYVAVVTRSAIVKINAEDKSQETIAAALPFTPNNAPLARLNTPASLAFGTGKGGRQLLFVTSLGMFGDPGLTKIDAGAPGQPIP